MTNHTAVIIRPVEEDLELVMQAMTEVHGRQNVDRDAVMESLRDLGKHLFLAIKDGRVVGSLNGYARESFHNHDVQFVLYEVDVRPECQGRGMGRALVNAFVALARTAGAKEVWVLTNDSNARALRMYQACGFSRINKDDVMLSLLL